MATISELEKQIADLDSKLKYGVGYKLRERNEALEFTRQQIQKAEAAGDAAKVERETRILGNILQEVSDLNGQVAAIQSQKEQLQQELNNL
jgi:chromosome segregation ATPase